MKVLVTGGAGYIGSHTTHQLVAAGHEVVVLDNLSVGREAAVPARAQLVKGEIGDADLLRRIFREHKTEAVVHFGAFIKVDESVREPLKYYWNNATNSQILIGACVEAGIGKLIFSSSAAVYGNPVAPIVNEDTPTVPISPYGASKLMTEWVLRDVSLAHPFRYVALRYFNVAGAGQNGKLGQLGPASHLIKVACEAACGKRPNVSIYGSDYPTKDGTGVRDYIHVDDLAAAHVDALKYLAAGGSSQVLNCGYGQGSTVREVIEAVKKVSGVNFAVKVAPRRAGDPVALVAESSRIRQLIGWKPQFADLSVICASALQWEKRLEQLDSNAGKRVA